MLDDDGRLRRLALAYVEQALAPGITDAILAVANDLERIRVALLGLDLEP
jgi:hypothetical protein